jgi:hypothetical protein
VKGGCAEALGITTDEDVPCRSLQAKVARSMHLIEGLVCHRSIVNGAMIGRRQPLAPVTLQTFNRAGR